MGKDVYCDFCRKSVPEAGLTPVKFGDEVIGEACLTCSSSVKTILRKQMAEIEAGYKAALKAPAPAPAPPEGPPAPRDMPAPPEIPPTTTASGGK